MTVETTRFTDAIRDRFLDWTVVAGSDRDEAEWWAGAPSVARGPDGVFWMSARMRTADAPLGYRGYEIRIFRSDDGLAFEPVHSIKREEIPLDGFERSSLVYDAAQRVFRLYGCSPIHGTWTVLKWGDAIRPNQFAPSAVQTVIEAETTEEVSPNRGLRARSEWPDGVQRSRGVDRERRLPLLRDRDSARRTHLPLSQRRRGHVGAGWQS